MALREPQDQGPDTDEYWLPDYEQEQALLTRRAILPLFASERSLQTNFLALASA